MQAILFVCWDFQPKFYSKYLVYQFYENLIITIAIYYKEEVSQSEHTLEYHKIQYLDVYGK